MSTPDFPLCTDTDGGIILTLYIQPRASKNEVCGIQGNALKIRLTSPPVDGAANKCCCDFMVELFKVPRSGVQILSGKASRHKRVRICGKDPAELRLALEGLITKHC